MLQHFASGMKPDNLKRGRRMMVTNLEGLFKKAKNKWNQEYEEFVSGIKMQAARIKIECEMRSAQNQGEISSYELIQRVIESYEEELMSEVQSEDQMREESKKMLKQLAKSRSSNRQANETVKLPRVDAAILSNKYAPKINGCGEDAFWKVFTND